MNETVLGLVEKRLEEILKRIKNLEKLVHTNTQELSRLKESFNSLFTMKCPNCGSPINTWPIPYFMIKAIHIADALASETRGIWLNRTWLNGPQSDWQEHVVKCKNCGKEYHIVYW